jgi:hypothetical protein
MRILFALSAVVTLSGCVFLPAPSAVKLERSIDPPGSPLGPDQAIVLAPRLVSSTETFDCVRRQLMRKKPSVRLLSVEQWLHEAASGLHVRYVFDIDVSSEREEKGAPVGAAWVNVQATASAAVRDLEEPTLGGGSITVRASSTIGGVGLFPRGALLGVYWGTSVESVACNALGERLAEFLSGTMRPPK